MRITEASKYTKTYATMSAARRAAEQAVAKLPENLDITLTISLTPDPTDLSDRSRRRFYPVFHLRGNAVMYGAALARSGFNVIG